MPLNTADILKRALAIPVQQGVTAAAQTVGGLLAQGAKTASDVIVNFGVPSAAQKAAEAIGKTVEQGNTKSFNSVTRQVNLVYENYQCTVREAATNLLLGKVGEKDTPPPPSEFVQSEKTPPMSEMKVSIKQEPGGLAEVVFDVMPTISEGRSVQYEPFSPLHHPGEILKYKTTASRTWSIEAKLVSRNVEEATRNLAMINAIRAWAMPYYGEGTKATSPTLLGAPPPILTLTAYGKNMIGPVKCVMESYGWTWPNDVDFLPAVDVRTGENRPFPVILSVSISLKEAWSPAEYSGFSIQHYQRGEMPEAFSAINRTKPQTAVPPTSSNPNSIERSQPTSLNQGGVNNASSNLASNVPSSWGGENRGGIPSLATPGFNPNSGQIGGAVPGTDIYGNPT
jgi:hypothetical protein